MIENKDNFPKPGEIQKEIKEFLEKKYGAKVAFAEPDYLGSKAGMKGETNEDDLSQIQFELKPEELEGYLKQYVVGQEEAIAIISTKICTHFNRMKFERDNPQKEEIVGQIKPNILLIGPTGVGKTYMVKLIAKKLGVPFVKGDATKFSETGYVGGDVEDLVRDLVHEAKGSIRLAEYGIIYIDEIDKIASSHGHWGPDVSRTGVQRNLLKLMEETEVDLKVPHDLASQMEAVLETQRTGKAPRKKVNTKNILFVVSGAFIKLDEIVRRRMKVNKIGFTEEPKPIIQGDQYLEHIQAEDLMEYGFETEFVGRLPVIGRLKDLGVEGLCKILKNPHGSIVSSKARDFEAYSIELNFDDDALRLIAELADKEKTGARGLVSVMEKILLQFEKKLPSTSIKKLTVSKDVVENGQMVLKKMLVEEALTNFQREFWLSDKIILEFTPEAKNWLYENSTAEVDPAKYLQDAFKDYAYGLKLLNLENFKITLEALKNPKEFLNKLIKKSYQKTRS